MNSIPSATATDTPTVSPQTEQAGLSTIDRAMIVIIAITLAGSCLLISSVEGATKPGGGYRPWQSGSILKIITDLQNFNGYYPTQRGVEVKWLMQGLGAAAVLLTAVIAWFSRTGRDEENVLAPGGYGFHDESSKNNGISSVIAPVTAAQIALVMFAGWSMLSALWAVWPAAALGDGARQLIVIIGAVALGRTLGRSGARVAAWAMVMVLAVTAGLGIWYYFERSPQMRLEFPIGNPIFLGACLLPGILLSATMLVGTLAGAASRENRLPLPTGYPHLKSTTRNNKWWLVLILALSMSFLLWAFWLTKSRAPLVGLVVGFTVVAYLAIHKRFRWVLIIVIFLGALAGGWWFKSQLALEHMGRGATVRLRFYAWEYALNLFLQRPDIGKGQNGYLLLAQQMSRPDAERDPSAFPGPLLGHAHSEWLEILTDLGAVGIALCITALGITFWSAIIALRRTENPANRWCLLGLLAVFVAIIVEECADVALRLPGLPVIFYTVIGLIWAMSREERSSTVSAVHRPSTLVRVAGLTGAILAAGVISSVVWRDWEAALAGTAITRYADKDQWDRALEEGRMATTNRLFIDDCLAADYQIIYTAYHAAAYQVQQSRQMVDRLDQEVKSRAHIPRIAREDSLRFESYFKQCVEKASRLLSRMPAYPYVAGLIADVYLLKQQMESTEKQLGLRDEVHSYLPQAHAWMELEYKRDPLDPVVALRLLRLSEQQPMSYKLNLLRIPLRSGPILPDIEPILAELMRKGDFQPAINQRLSQAKAAMSVENAGAWPDWYAPETLRLGALAVKLTGDFAGSARMARDAAKLSEKIRPYFPTAVSRALVEQAGYLLLAYPNDAKQAVQICQQAIDEWPEVGDRRQQLLPVYKDLSLYQLAAGEEEAAGKTLRLIIEDPSPEHLNRNIGYGLAELCQTFIVFKPDHRPVAFGDWLGRSMELAPEWPASHRIAAQVAYESGDKEAAIKHLQTSCRLSLEQGNDTLAARNLESLEKIFEDPKQMSATVQSLLEQFPENPVLHTYIASRPTYGLSATQPDGNIQLPAKTQPSGTE